MTYGLFSDIHAHAWSAFSSKLPNGRNSRLQIIVDELRRGAYEVRASGNNSLVIAGDIFHTRGSLDPEVFNPVSDLVDELLADRFRIVALAGNHDLKSNESTELGNAFQSFGKRPGFTVVTKPEIVQLGTHRLMMVPWIPKLDDLKATLETWANKTTFTGEMDLVMHAGIDGVLSGMPAHGLTPAYLAGLGFHRVFSGHYHHHCAFEDGMVFSIGATTHQTASDIGTKAGFLMVGTSSVVYRASQAPEFVEVTDETEADDIPDVVDGNYVRVRGLKLSAADEAVFRDELLGMGAKGVVMNVERETTNARTGAAVSVKAKSLEVSVAGYVDRLTSPHKAAIQARASSIISSVRAASD